MIQTVFCFEKILIQHIVVRYMAVVTIRVFSMRAMHPTVVDRSHHVAIDAGLWIVGEIRSNLRFLGDE